MGNCVGSKTTVATRDGIKEPIKNKEGGDIRDNKKDKNQRIVDSIEGDVKVGEYLKKVPILSHLSEEGRAKVGGALSLKNYNDGDLIIEEGTKGHGFYIFKSGNAIVTKKIKDDVTNEIVEKEIGRLTTGEYCGEAALVNNTSRGASVRAVGKVKCYFLDRDNFYALFDKNILNVRFAKRMAVSAETFQNIKNKHGAPVDAEFAKDEKVKELLVTTIKMHTLFEHINEEQLTEVVGKMYKKIVKAGTTIIKQGANGDNFYVVEQGNFDVFKNGKPKKIATLGANSCFGELALMYNSPRSATVVAVEDSVLWCMDRYTFRVEIQKVNSDKQDVIKSFIDKVDILRALTNHEKNKIVQALEEEQFGSGDIIVKEGDDGDKFYLVYNGEVSVTKKAEKGILKTYRSGDYFGEKALIQNEARAATCKATKDTVCLTMLRADFTMLFGPLEDIMKHEFKNYERADSLRKTLVPEFKMDLDVGKDDLETVGLLGKGSFGSVYLVQHKKTKKTYALKCVNKHNVVELGQQTHILSEKNVMMSMNHPFLIRCYATFQDKDTLYFLLEPSLGGELFRVLRARAFFDEPTARFYAACVILAFEHMHSKKIIYRDLKPENLLIDKQGYLKITDFGFAKVVRDRTWTLCGTPDYLAPEVVSGQGHAKAVDWWTLGILIYEMLASYPPFYDDDQMQTYAKILQGRIDFPSHFSLEAIDLIQKLLQLRPTRRIGVGRDGAAKIKKHSWFRGFDWEKMEQRKMVAPIIPKIDDDLCLDHFETYDESDEELLDFDDDDDIFKDF